MTTHDNDIELAFQRDCRGRLLVTHEWPVDASRARRLQSMLARHAITHDTFACQDIHTVAGVDIGFEDKGRTTRAAVVVLDAQTLQLDEQLVVRRPTRMPYIPGLLSFRETPAAREAIASLSRLPDLLMVDGHGIAHPRRIGVATHLGLITGIPAIGIAKKRLTGTHGEIPQARLAWTPLYDGHETIGVVMRSRTRVKPIFISSGHGIGLGLSIEWTQRTLTRYRLPETTRAADRLASRR